MADEILINKRIDQLAQNAVLKGSYYFPIRNMDNNTTERVLISEILSGTTTGNFEWVTDNDPGYAEDQVVTYQGKWYQSNINNNLNNVPGISGTWDELNKSPSGLALWEAGVYAQDTVIVIYDTGSGPKLYYLAVPERPYASFDFEAELLAGDWVSMSSDTTVGEGLDDDGGAVKLGSPGYPAGNPIVADRYIQVNNSSFLFVSSDGSTILSMVANVDKEALYIQATNKTTLEYVTLILDLVDGSGVKFADTRNLGNKKGIEYSDIADYAGELGPDSLVPRSLVESLISSSASNMAIDGTYATIAAMLADQANQELGAWYMVQDASADPTVDAGWAIYQKLGTSTADLSDYFKILEQEGLDLVVNNASETDKGIVEEATDAEMQAGTAVGGTGAKLFVGPAKLATWWTWIKTLAHTFAAQITFTLSPIITPATASKFVRTGASKELVTVDPATQAEMITGTDDTKPSTPLSNESKRSIKSVSISNGATGSTNIDCGSKQEIKVVYNTTVTGNITITKSNDTNLEVLNIVIPITGASIAITMPSDVRMNRYLETASGLGWAQSTKILTVGSVGTADLHEFSFVRAGSIFILRYDGPVRA